ncbi:DUF115 domain-containing protein [Halovenus sp. WSH3]|uniref:6-hydroxymethyl-7,8-dihydropterin pyrophosphokinase n=1 Tax=Halovenus carboxidivorans TaxID=2692199 RepID=A0A6B0T2N3_9EURY|nr:DUF115 domain-containing protein [Halovenus carboxidivorans]
MEFDEWEPVYERILSAFGYGRGGDERVRDRLQRLVAGSETFETERVDWTGQTVAIAGGADSLIEPTALQTARDADIVVAASVAADRLRDREIAVDCMVTDLDKNPATVRDLTADGVPAAVHAHGDNLDLVEEWVPRLDTAFVIPTTQAEPTGAVHNFGGFTDGDRAAFLADEFGAARLVFPGWEFDDPTVDEEKRAKLGWAERLLHWLERRRDERFDILDGRRADIDRDALPL